MSLHKCVRGYVQVECRSGLDCRWVCNVVRERGGRRLILSASPVTFEVVCLPRDGRPTREAEGEPAPSRGAELSEERKERERETGRDGERRRK